MLELTGEDEPHDLAHRARGRAHRRGRSTRSASTHATALARALLDGGAPGLHLYTFNQRRRRRSPCSRGVGLASATHRRTRMTTDRTFPTGTILGYPRIGRRRELKHAVEAFWAGTHRRRRARAPPPSCAPPTRERLVELGLGRDRLRRSPRLLATTTRCSTPRSRSAPCPTRFARPRDAAAARPRGLLHARPRRRPTSRRSR